MKGVRAVVTAADVPLNVYGHLSALGIPGDEPLLAEKEVRYVGQPIAVVAAEDDEVAQAAVDAIEVDYEVREPLFDVRKAFDPDAPQIHEWGTGIRTSRAASTTGRSARATSTPPSRRPT